MEKTPLLMLGLPKGSLQDSTIKLFGKAGYQISVSSRSYRPSIDDEELDGRFVRAQEVSRYVEHGYFDCGLTGQDWVVENDSDVVEVCSLVYSRASNVRSKWIIAVPENSPVQSVKDLEGKRIATEVVNITNKYLADNGVNADVEFSWGATEVKARLVDAIVDVTETGSSIRANNLRIVDTLLTSFPHFYGSKGAYQDDWKKTKMDRMVLMLKAALEARGKVGLKMNLPEKSLPAVLDKLPSLRRPTVSHLAEDNWVAVETIIEDSVARNLIPDLKALGAEGIIEYPLSKIVL